jgi:hypothetical protein
MFYMKSKVGLILFLSFLSISKGFPQNTNPYIPKILSPSPNAASLMKFTDVPVSTYNGTADISIPFYSIDVKDVSVPIGIANHTGGVKIKDESGLVGLGWALNAGGMISREFRDQDDFGGEYFNEPVPEITSNILRQPQPGHFIADFGATGYIFFCDYLLHTDQGNVNYATALQGATTIWDMEPDIFSYNFPGHSGKFMITRTGTILMQKQENLSIQYSPGGASFTILDDQANTFYFSDKELVQSANYVGQRTSSWMLTRIITQAGDIINFTYLTDNSWSFVPADIFQTSRTGCSGHEGLFYSQPAANQYLNLTIQTIDFPKGQIQFQTDNVREDLQNGKKVTAVKIYSKISGTSALTYLKEFDMYYSYFYSGFTPVMEYERLRLDSLKELSNGISLPPYKFSYNASASSYAVQKHGFSVDHWGFCNGQGNSSFIPTFSSVVQGTYLNIPGANREADPTNENCFSLSQITYPTGGSTALEYEPNNYDQPKSTTGPVDFPYLQLVPKLFQYTTGAHGTQSGSIDLSNIYPVSVTNPNCTFSVNFRIDSAGAWQTYRNTFRKIYFVFDGITVDINDNDVTCIGANCNVSYQPIIRVAQSYSWSVYIDPSIDVHFEDVTALITWQEIANINNPHLPLIAGGLRIKSITDYSSNGVPAKKRRYAYDNENPSNLNTYGRLMSPPSYARLELLYYATVPPGQQSYMFPDGSTSVCASLTQTGSSNNAVTSVVNGNIVGYDTVKEYMVDPASGVDIGKTVYVYFNTPDTVLFFNGFRLPGISNIGNNLNGSLLSKIVYKNVNNTYLPITESDNFYHTTNRTAVYSAKYNLLTNPSGLSTDCPGNVCNPNEYQADFFPSIKSERTLLDSSYETIYDQNDPTRSMVTKKYYSYDNPKHYQLTRTRQLDSKGNTIVNNTKFPQDYVPNGSTYSGNTILDTMIKRNMVSEVVENRDSLYFLGSSSGFVTSAKLNTYKVLTAGGVAKDKIYMLNIAGPVSAFTPYTVNNNTTSRDSRYRQMISFDLYDSAGNIKQYTATDQIPVSFVWDYLNMFPIAQVKGAINSDIAFTSFEANGMGNWTFSSAGVSSSFALTGFKSFNLSGNSVSKNGLVSGRKYVLSYWSRGSASTITGGTSTSTTGRSVNGWTYYQHLVTMTSTSLTVSGTTYIDELRLYPQTAQMTSLTYKPGVGTLTSNDPNSEISYYEYDSLQRLKNIKDYLGNITNNFQYNYALPCTVCGLQLLTYAHTPTLSYPVGVFSVANMLVGNATTPAQYISLWNGDANNHAVGTLTAGSDSLHFVLTLNAGQTSPGFVIGCRYYQFDLAYTQLDAIRNSNGVYVNYGDGTGMFLGKTTGDSNVYRAPGTTINVQYSYSTGTPYIYWIHAYSDGSLKTVTIYHNDGSENNGLDNAYAPATSLNLVQNFRGNLPQFTTLFDGDCNQQANYLSVAGITNWASINSILGFLLVTGDLTTACIHVSYAQDFMANNKNLQSIVTNNRGYYLEGFEDPTFKISKLKSGWNTYFTNLTTLQINDDHWNHEDLTNLTHLNLVSICASNTNHSYIQTGNPLIPITVSVIDNVINQIASGAGLSVRNGLLNILSGGTARSTTSNTAVTNLKAMGWTVIVNGVTQ